MEISQYLWYIESTRKWTFQVVQAIGRTLNFKPVFEHPGPARWGTILPNGTHTGMVGKETHIKQYIINKQRN